MSTHPRRYALNLLSNRDFLVTAACLVLSVPIALYLYSPPAIDPVQAPEIERILGQLQSTLPVGWNATAEKDVITIRKNGLVRVFYDIALRHPMTRDQLKTYTRLYPLYITAQISPRLSPEEYRRRVEVNRETEEAIRNFEKTKLGHLRSMKPRHTRDRSGYYYPERPGDEALIAEFSDFIQSLPTYDVPNYYSETHSYLVSSSLELGSYLFEPEQEAEYAEVWKNVTSLFRPHANAWPLLLYWHRGRR